MDRNDRVLALTSSALANGGWVTVAMAEAVGIPRATFYRLMTRHGWERIQPGVFRLPGAELSWKAHLRAALHHVGEPCAVTGDAALVLHGLTNHRVKSLQLVLPGERSTAGVLAPVDAHRSVVLRQDDIDMRRSWPVTPVAWALAHRGRTTSRTNVLATLLAARQAELVTTDEVDDVLARMGTATGAASLRWARRSLDREQPDSLLEHRVRRLLARHKFRPTGAPFPYALSDGRVLHIDVVFPEAWVALEVDGIMAHTGDRAFTTDRQRWDALQDEGWRVIWVTSPMLRDPRALLRGIGRAMVRPGRPEGVAPPTPCTRATCPPCRAHR